MRVEPTPDSEWLRALDEASRHHLQRLAHLPVIVEAGTNGLAHRDSRTNNFFLQIGTSLVQPFRGWLINMQAHVAPRSEARLFFERNADIEKSHWDWWQLMARAYGVNPNLFRNVQLRPHNQELFDHLTAISQNPQVAFGLATINYTIETGTGYLTGLVSARLLDQLNGSASRWVRVHASGDKEHSAQSRHLLQERVKDDDLDLQKWLAVRVNQTYGLFYKALEEAYAASLA